MPHRPFPRAARDGPPVVLVTGCGRGLGLALARRLHASGDYRVVATARAGALADLPTQVLTDGPRCRLMELDVLSPTSRDRAVAAVEAQWGGVDILINNAAISYRAAMELMAAEDEALQMRTNYLGPVALCRRVLPHMRAQRWGRILNISSVSGMMAMPTMGSYSASKWALEGASEALWYELRPWGIGVSLIQPGFLHSDGFLHVRHPQPGSLDALGEQAYERYEQAMAPFIARLMRRSRATPELVATRILKLLRRRRLPLRHAVTWDAKGFYLLRRLLPRRLYHAILYRSLPGRASWVEEKGNAAALAQEDGGHESTAVD